MWAATSVTLQISSSATASNSSVLRCAVLLFAVSLQRRVRHRHRPTEANNYIGGTAGSSNSTTVP